MNYDLILSPFDREVIGAKGHILARRNREHEKAVVSAIRHRDHPGWSSMGPAVRVAT